MMITKSNSMMVVTSLLLFAFVLLSPTIVVAQVSPWSLFQQLCSGGRLATGPQYQGLLQGQQPSSTTGTTTAAGTCPTGFVIQNNFCVSSTTSTTTGTTSTISQPIANAGPSQTVCQGSLVTLVGTGSFSPNGGTIVSYSWVQTSGTPVSLTGANTATPTFTAPTATTSLVFSLTVTDSNGAVSNPATVTITVS
jgi:PKD domain